MAKILIHALGANMGGAKRHLDNFLPLLSKLDKRNDYTLIIRADVDLPSDISRIHILKYPIQKYNDWRGRLLVDFIHIPKIVSKNAFDLVVSLTNFGPLQVPCKHVVFQRNPIYFCKYYLSNIRGVRKIETALKRKAAVEMIKRASIVVTPSHAMALMIMAMYPMLDKNKFRTLYHGFTKDNYPKNSNKNVLDKIDGSSFKLLYPTHPGIHKGFDILFKAIKKLEETRKDFTVYLTLSSRENPQEYARYIKQIQRLGIQERVQLLGIIPQDQMRVLYEMCDLMVYPSLCESFGFSMVEALGFGLPIVAADTAINREICGEGALYYSPLNFEEGARAIDKALNASVKDTLKEGGKSRFESYDWTWQRYVGEFCAIVESVLHE